VVNPAELCLPSVRNATDASPTANLLLLCGLSDSCPQYYDAGLSVYMVRGVTEVQTETVARDGMGDDFIAALLKSRVSEIIPEDLLSPVSLASRAYHDLD
jgi:hypothetical protein